MNTNQQLSLLRHGQPDEEAIRLIKGYEAFALTLDPRGYCVCTSEGKDSRVLGHLMRRAGVKHFYLHNITGIDPPELVYFQRRNFQEYADQGYEVHDIMYEKSIWALIKQNKFPPMRKMRYCCKHLKERRTSEYGGAMIATGVRKAESTQRKKYRSELEIQGDIRDAVTHLNPYDQDGEIDVETFRACFDNPEWALQGGLFTLNPIAEWPAAWIWDYSAEAGLEQCIVYQEGFDRLGCIGCPMAGECGRRREFERWPAFELMWRRAFDGLVALREELGLIQRFKSGAEWFEWWLSDAVMEEPVNEDQMTMYE